MFSSLTTRLQYRNLKKVRVIIGAILLIILAVLNFAPLIGIPNTANTIITLLAGLVFLLVHGSGNLGWRNLIVFLVIIVAVSFTAEAVGVATGLVFGKYYYTDQLGPKILGVPPLIQVGYAVMGYCSLMLSRILFGVSGTPKKFRTALLVTLVGALLMVGWDVAMDPYQSTAAGTWIWQTGGEYFGVGMHNYFGWFGTVFAFMLVYQFFSAKFPEVPMKKIMKSRFFRSQPVLYYALTAIGIITVPWVGGVALPYATPANYNGALQTLEYSLALVAMFVMGTPVIVGLSRVFSKDLTS